MQRHKKGSGGKLTIRERQICSRLGEARNYIGISQEEAARKIGIPKSTLSNHELGIVPLRATLALRICRKLILSEEWLATGDFKLTERAGKTKNVVGSEGMFGIYVRQCMDLAGSPEGVKLPQGILFGEAFEKHLASTFEKRILSMFYFVGIPATSWANDDLELGADIARVLIERSILILQVEAANRGASAQYAGATYLGFVLRMALFGFHKCIGNIVSPSTVGLPEELFTDPKLPITAFKSAVDLGTTKTSPAAAMVSH